MSDGSQKQGGGLLVIDEAMMRMFKPPTVVYTLESQTHAKAVLDAMKDAVTPGTEYASYRIEFHVFKDDEAVTKFFSSNGHTAERSLALCDLSTGRRFSPTTRARTGHGLPDWAGTWGVRISSGVVGREGSAANQILADFFRNFSSRTGSGWFPWGPPRKRSDKPPVAVEVDREEIRALEDRLNSGPNMRELVADVKDAAELPKEGKLSFLRITPEALRCNVGELVELVRSFEEFEVASARLLGEQPGLAELVLCGVTMEERLRPVYLNPRTDRFSVRRPDLHVTADGVFSSENDEMPGGMADTVHLDNAYGVNQERWKRAFDWLHEDGTLVLLVSHQWSRCYYPEMQWLAGYLQAKGYDTVFVTTEAEDLSRFTITDREVRLDGKRVGTIWRQFPVFEAVGKLADLVLASHDGKVRMCPDFAHYGNKVWFSIFRSHTADYRRFLSAETFARLDEILPHSHLVRSEADFPVTLGGRTYRTVDDLLNAPEADRNTTVLKIVGANNLAARSYGVLMGRGIGGDAWKDWIRARTGSEPYLVQHALTQAVLQVPVWNTGRQQAEAFNARVLLRPFSINNELVGVCANVVPAANFKVHGMVPMAMTSVDLGS